MPIVHADGADLYWERSGTGAPLLLIMGLGWSADLWYRVVPGFEEHFEVIRYDARGIGRSSVPPGPYPIELAASDAAAVLTAAGHDDAFVLGVSLGGIVAQELVLSHGDRVRRLVLAATHPGGREMVPPDPEVLQVLTNPRRLSLEESIRAGNAYNYHPSTPVDRIEEDIRRRIELPTNAKGYYAQLAGGASFGGAVPRLRELRTPVLVLAGEDDRLIPSQNSRLIADAIPDSELIVLPDTGHVVFTEAPEQLVSAATEFFLRSGED